MSSTIKGLTEVIAPLITDMIPISQDTGNTKKVQLVNLVGQHPSLPTTAEKSALGGTSGTPGAANSFVTNDDSRNSNARTPSAHGSSHGALGSDPVIVSPSQVTGVAVTTGDSRLSDARTPTAHADCHVAAGTDPLTLSPAQVTGTAVVTADARLSDARTPTAHATSHAALGSDPLALSPSQVTGTAVITTDARLSDARTPTAHATTHASGGTDAVSLGWAQVSKSGSSLADLATRSAADLSSGTLALARLSGITDTEIAALAAIAYSKLSLGNSIVNADIATAAAIVYSKLVLTNSVVNADIAAAAAIAWSKLSKSGSSLADLATRSAGDLTSGTLPVARLGNGVTSAVTTTSTGTQNDFAPSLAGDTLVRCNNATDLTITGLGAGLDGQRVTFVSIGVGNVFFKHQSTGSIAANRFTNLVTSGDTPIASNAGGHATYMYDATSTTWRLLTHDQGARLTWSPTYTASASMTFTGVSTSAARYYLKGRIALITYDFTGTVGGTPDVKIFMSLPNSWTAPVGAFNTYDAGIGTISIMQSRSATATLEFYSTPTGAVNWGAGSQRILGTVETELT